MAVRPIDAVQVLHNINLHHRPTPVSEFESGFNNGLNQAMWEITHAPTLTQPNEGAKDKNVPKHFIGLSDNVTYVVEDLEVDNVDQYSYTLNFNPKMWIPVTPGYVD